MLAMATFTIAPAIPVPSSFIAALRQQARSFSTWHEASRLSSSARRSSNLRTAHQQKPQKRREDFSCRAASFAVTLRTPLGEKTLSVPDDVYILDAAEDMGFPLPYSCRSGACSSCAALVKEGKIDQSNQTYLEESQLEEGYVLTCVAYPLSDVILETHQEHGLY